MTWVRRLQVLVVVIGCVAAVWGVSYWVNGLTQTRATVKAPVQLLGDPSRPGWANVPVHVDGVEVPDGWLAGARPEGWSATASSAGMTGATRDGALTIVAWDSTFTEQLLALGDWLVDGLALLVGALALAPVLGSIAQGRPFAPGNARALVVIAAAVVVDGMLAPALPAAAGIAVLHRLGLAGPQFADTVPVSFGPLLVGAVVLAVAAAFRAGERMADDVRGLV